MSKGLTKEDRKLILDERMAWRNVFNSPSGRIVFRRIAKECYFFNDEIAPDNWDAIGKNNFFKTIIERLGVADDPDMTADAVADAIIDAVLKLPLTVGDIETEEDEN